MSVTFEIAHTHEQGVDFVVVLVAGHVMTSPREQESVAQLMLGEYGPIPVVFATQTGGGVEYRGRRDIVDFLSGIFVEQLPWKRVTFSQAA